MDDGEGLLWQRVAALRGIRAARRGDRAHVSGERFQVQVSGIPAGQAHNIEGVARLLCDSGCRGVIGEIVVKRNDPPRRARIATRHGLGTPTLDWRRSLVEREAERLARLQPARRSL
jgi:hypothetical protein